MLATLSSVSSCVKKGVLCQSLFPPLKDHKFRTGCYAICRKPNKPRYWPRPSWCNKALRQATLIKRQHKALLIIALQQLLGLPQPRYLHVPLIIQPDGHKLGKSYRSPPLPADQATPLLIRALRVLGQQLPDAADYGEPTELLRWASMHWDATRIPRSLTLAEAQLR